MRLLFTLFSILLSFACFGQQTKVAIVIDDIGYRLTDAHALTLPGEVTFSFLPHTPHGKNLAEIAHRQHKEVLIHVPMESTIGKKLGPGAITSNMDEAAIRGTLSKSFQEMPFAVGINNHMGSHLTTLYQPMAWTMRYLKDHDLLFLDSVTSSHSKGSQVAKQFGVPVMRRHVFLDNQLDVEYITKQFNQLISKAKSNEVAVGIAHPHPESIKILSALIPTLSAHNIALVKLSTLYKSERKNTETLLAE